MMIKNSPYLVAIVANGRITNVGVGVKAPAAATVVNLAGKTVMPGLVNAHDEAEGSRSAMSSVPAPAPRRPTRRASTAPDGRFSIAPIRARARR
jgi:imidazolonepropionase-like amidohydrolase